MLFITAHIFLIINLKILHKLLDNDFFSIIKDMVKARFKIENLDTSDIANYDEFIANKKEIYGKLKINRKKFNFDFLAKL